MEKEKQLRFWSRWLFWANIMTVGIGVMAAFFSSVILLRPWNAGIEQVFFHGNPIPPEVMPLKNWLMGIIGGTIVGFHLLMAMIAYHPFAKGERWAWVTCWLGLLGWFCIDSGLSAFYGAWFNIYLINGVALIAIGLPLIATRKCFRK